MAAPLAGGIPPGTRPGHPGAGGRRRGAFADGHFRLELGYRVDNPASCRVATRADFITEGTEGAELRYGDARFAVETHARLATDPAPDVVPLPGSV